MDNKYIESVLANIKSIQDHQSTIFEMGHDFWHCDAVDKNDKTGEYLPFRYYQTNRTVSMSTCGNCQKLMELRREIRKLQKSIGIPLTPLNTRETSENEVKMVSVKGGATAFNYTASYAGWNSNE